MLKDCLPAVIEVGVLAILAVSILNLARFIS